MRKMTNKEIEHWIDAYNYVIRKLEKEEIKRLVEIAQKNNDNFIIHALKNNLFRNHKYGDGIKNRHTVQKILSLRDSTSAFNNYYEIHQYTHFNDLNIIIKKNSDTGYSLFEDEKSIYFMRYELLEYLVGKKLCLNKSGEEIVAMLRARIKKGEL